MQQYQYYQYQYQYNGIGWYWYWSVLVLGIAIPNLIHISIGCSGFSYSETTFALADGFSTKFDQRFSGVRNPNPVSDGRNYALNFLTKEALLGQDIHFPQSLPIDCRGRANRIFNWFLRNLHHAEDL